jgi:serine/threonine-protein kinase
MEQTHFGRYVIVAELGRGAMGAVHRAVDPLIERDVAIKTLLPNMPPEIMDEVRERFLREARSAGRLNHPNIVTIYDVGEQDGVAYIAMELLEGRSLQQILRETPRLPLERVADLVAQIADGLDLAQRYKITHRDIKPANVMVSSDWRAKLTDFGVAHVASSSMTQTGTALGSPKYMSPEQVTGQPLDPRSDIFSLGSVLYEMLVGHTPFERKSDTTVFALMNRIAGEAHVPVTQVDAKIPAAFNAILDKALGKSSDKRYQRAGEMANDLRNLKALAGGAASGGIDQERSAAGPRPPSQAPKPDPATATLIEDLDVFSKDFERQEQETLRLESLERQRKADELRRWAEAEEKRRQEFEREREAKSGGTQTGQRRSAALDLLKQKAADKTATVGVGPSKKAEFAARIDEGLRAAFRYLSEFTTVLNEANPESDGKQGVMFFGERTGMILGEGFTDMRTRDLNGKSCADYVTFKYRVRFPKPEKLEVTGQEAQRVQERLKAMGVKHEMSGKKNDLGQLTSATFTMSGPFPCQALLRADYDEPGFVLELVNVRHYGQAKLRLGPEELDDNVLDEFGTWVLGADDAFERFLKRRA